VESGSRRFFPELRVFCFRILPIAKGLGIFKIVKSDKRNLSSAREDKGNLNQGKPMLWTIFVILLVLWLLGLVSSYTMGGFIHILLVIAVVILIINLIQGRRTL